MILPPPPHISVVTGNVLMSIIRFACYSLLLAFYSSFMPDFKYLRTIQIWRNLDEYYYYLTSIKSVAFQIDANCFPFQSLNLLPCKIRLEHLKLIYYSLLSIFSKFYFKPSTLCLLFLSSHVFNSLEFDSNYFGILL